MTAECGMRPDGVVQVGDTTPKRPQVGRSVTPVWNGPPTLPETPFPRAVPTTPADRTGARAGCFPARTSLPRYSGGSASATSLSRPAQGSLELRPGESLNRQKRPLSRGFDPADYPAKPLASYRIKPTIIRVVPSSTGVPRLRGALNNSGYQGEQLPINWDLLLGPSPYGLSVGEALHRALAEGACPDGGW